MSTRACTCVDIWYGPICASRGEDSVDNDNHEATAGNSGGADRPRSTASNLGGAARADAREGEDTSGEELGLEAFRSLEPEPSE